MNKTLAGIPREEWLKIHGIHECSVCQSWICNTRAAIFFHFRRCNG